MAATGNGIPTHSCTNSPPNQYRSANPPRVRQSAIHKGFIEEVMPSLTLGSPSAQAAVLKIALCGTWNGVSLTRYDSPDRYWCEIRTCPNCGSRWKQRTGRIQAGQVRSLIGSDFRRARRITLNFDPVSERDVPIVVEAFRQVLSKFFERRLPSCALIGGFDFALEPGGLVTVHVHGTLIDLSGRIQQAVCALRKQFPDERRFWSKPLSEKLRDGRDGPEAWHSYGVDATVTAFKHNRESDWDHHQLVTAADKLRWIGLFEVLRNTKGNRIRTTIGFGLRRALNRLKREREEEDQRRTTPEMILDQTPRGETMGGMYYSSDQEEEGLRRPDRTVEGDAANMSSRPSSNLASAGVTCRIPRATTARSPP